MHLATLNFDVRFYCFSKGVSGPKEHNTADFLLEHGAAHVFLKYLCSVSDAFLLAIPDTSCIRGETEPYCHSSLSLLASAPRSELLNAQESPQLQLLETPAWHLCWRLKCGKSPHAANSSWVYLAWRRLKQ